jgi:sporulation protein YlmC with PRC-barrel domain
MDVPLDVRVYASDGEVGRSTAIIFDPATQQVTHFVALVEGSEYLVPIDAIAKSSPVFIRLSWSREELSHAEPFTKVVPMDDAQMAVLAAEMTAPSSMGPYASPDATYMAETLANSTMREEQVPANELTIHLDAQVEATDGSAGQVEEFIIDGQTSRISHLVLRQGHLWGQRDVSVPMEQVDRVENDVIYLKLDKKAIGQLPTAPVPKK